MRDGRCSCQRSNCSSPGKHPRTLRGKDDATTNAETISDWWERWPDANVAMRTLKLIVLDCDVDKGGAQSLAELERVHGQLPPTIEASTGGGGRHFAFLHPGFPVLNSASRIAPGLDVRGEHGYIIVAPSNHASGGCYAWVAGRAPDEIDGAGAPAWLLSAIVPRSPSKQRAQSARTTPEGEQRRCSSIYCRDELFSAASRYVAKVEGVSDGRKNRAFGLASHVAAFVDQHGCRLNELDAFDIVSVWNLKCPAPLDERELRYRIANGFRYGDRPDKPIQVLELVEPPPPPTPSAPVGESFEQACAQVVSAINGFLPGDTSMHLQAVPGSGKTTAAIRRAMDAMDDRLPGWSKCTVLAEPTVALVEEKAEQARRYVRETDLDVEVRVLRGKSADRESGWWCERMPDAAERAKLQRSSCVGCELFGRSYGGDWSDGPCVTTPTRFRHAREAALERLGRRRNSIEDDPPPPVLLVTTLDALHHAWTEIPRRATIIIDDAPLLGVLDKVELHAANIESELERAREWRSDTVTPQLVPAERIPEVLVCDLAVGVLEAISQGPAFGAPERVEAYVLAQPPELLQALQDGGFARPCSINGMPLPWPWEVFDADADPDGVPAYSDVAIRMAGRVAARGACPHIERIRRQWVVHLPDDHLVDFVRRGRVLWLAVESVPTWLVDRLQIDTTIFRACPPQLRAIVAERRVHSNGTSRIQSWGAGLRRGDQKVTGTATDRLIRDLAKEFQIRCDAGTFSFEGRPIESFAAVVHKCDRVQLEGELGTAAWCVHYGSGHAGTNALAEAELLLVRRYVLNPAALKSQAAALRRAFPNGGRVEPAQSGTVLEARQWTPSEPVIPTRVPADLLERELARSAESAYMTNAVGRCRPLTAISRRIVVICNGRPFDLGGATPEVWEFGTLMTAFGMESVLEPKPQDSSAALARFNAERAARQDAQQRAVRNLLRRKPDASTHTIEQRCNVSVRQARRLVAKVRAAEAPGAMRLAYATLRTLVITSATRSYRESIWLRLAEVSTRFGLKPLQEALAAMDAPCIAPITIRRRRREILRALEDDSELVLPSRSDHTESLGWVLRAMVRVAESGSAKGSSAGETLQFPRLFERDGGVG